MMTLRSVSRWVVVSMALAVGAPASAQWDPSPSSAFGDADEDVLCGARILDDARIVVGGSASVPADAELLAGATSGDRAVLARLSHDGRELLGASRLPGAVWDLDGHGADLVVAAGDGGLLTERHRPRRRDRGAATAITSSSTRGASTRPLRHLWLAALGLLIGWRRRR